MIWEPPSRDTWNGNLLGYHVGYLEVSRDDSVLPTKGYTFKSVEVRQHFGGEATLQGLMKYTTYNIIVQVNAISNLHTHFPRRSTIMVR